ncbi:MAG: tetratricopeptide repeat protein [Planctomycetes bacterium]|nr:tetratricopeptide repeat protein [Planctomycetota bacterium]
MTTPPPSTKSAPVSVLTPWQRPVVRLLTLGTVLVGGTGLFLGASTGASPGAASAFVAHVVVGALLVPLLLAFAVPHAVTQTKRKPLIALSGAVVLLAALAATASGVSLLIDPPGARGSVGLLHTVTGLAVLALYLLHRRFGSNPAPWASLGAGVAGVAVVGLGLLLWEAKDGGPTSVFETGSAEAAEAARVHFFPTAATSGAGGLTLTSDEIRDVASCASCHRVITDEWKRSAHRHASMTNPVYRATIHDLRDRFPKTDARWCAGCHDPALLYRQDAASGLPPIAAPELDFESDDARTGLTCVICHSIEPQSTNGNADFVVRGRKVYAWEKSGSEALRKAHDILLRLKPAAHAKSLTPDNIQTSAFCSVCHKAEPPPELTRWRWARAQDEYDAHDDSGVTLNNVRSFYHPKDASRCQDCHMPLVADRDDPAADGAGMVRSHLFAAANTMLPHLRGDEDMIRKIKSFLATSCRVDVSEVVLPGDRRFVLPWQSKPAVKPGEVVEAHVVVRNKGVGHRFPGGTVDSNEVWLAFEASVDGEPAFYASGRLDPATGRVDESAEFYRAYWIRKDGTRFVSRVANDLHTLVYVTRIGPGTADVVRYRFRVPEGAKGRLELKATLRYRKFAPDVLGSVYKYLGVGGTKIRHVPEKDFLVKADPVVVDMSLLPVVDMASGSLSLPVTAEGTPGAPPEVTSLPLGPDDRDRVNDLAIAHLIQGDPDRARELFRLVTRIDPKYADGFVNVARAAFAKQDFDDATVAVGEALRLRPGFPKALFFRGMVRRNSPGGDFAGAEADFRAVLATWPREREAHRRLADVLFQQDRFADALEVLGRYKAIDPEDWEAWYWEMRCHEALGDVERAAAAKTAFDKYRPDDDMLHRRGPYLLDDPNLHRLAQPIHVHEQPGLAPPSEPAAGR